MKKVFNRISISYQLLILVLGAFCVNSHAAEQATDQAAKQSFTIIHAAKVMVRAGEPIVGPASIVIKGSEVTAVIKGYQKTFGDEVITKIIDLKDKFLLPGLIDSHVHLQMGNTNKRNPEEIKDSELAFYGAHSAALTLAAGFTTVRDLGSANETIFDLRNAIASGLIPGPRVIASGEAVSITGGHGTAFCNGADDCSRAVREQIRLGADVIKLAATAGGNGYIDEPAEMNDDEMFAAVKAATKQRRKVAAHAHSIAGIKQAVEAGVSSIEHGSHLDKATAKKMRSNNTFLVPTLMVRDNLIRDLDKMEPALKQRVQGILDATKPTMQMAYKLGVKFASGSDAGVVKHGDNARELEWLVDVGMTPLDAIKAATINAAELLSMEDKVGLIAVGSYADIIAVNNDPTKDISVLRKVTFVMKNGVVVKQ